MNPYNVLNVPKDADKDAIKRAHRKAARQHHPDKGGKREDFEKVQHAYLVLADPVRRDKYDRTGSVDDEIENPMSILVEHVVAAFDAACQQNATRLTQRDLIAATRKIMEEQLATMHGQLGNLEREKPKLEGLLKRLRFSGEGVDPIGSVLRQRIEGVDQSIADGEKLIAQYTAAIAYLDHYGFEFDQPPPPAPSGAYHYIRMDPVA